MVKSTNAIISSNWDAKRMGTSEYAILPDALVDMIHQNVSRRLWDNVEGYLSLGLFTGHPITRIELDYGNYIQMQRIEEQHGTGAYKITFSGRATQVAHVLFTDKETIISIIQSINHPVFFAEWRKKLAMDDFEGYIEECKPYTVTEAVLSAAR